jgi:hypothetical protein
MSKQDYFLYCTKEEVEDYNTELELLLLIDRLSSANIKSLFDSCFPAFVLLSIKTVQPRFAMQGLVVNMLCLYDASIV